MLASNYESQQIISLVESLLTSGEEGVLNLTTKAANQQQYQCSLILRHGRLIFADKQLPTALELSQQLGNKLNPSSINAAILVAEKRLVARESHQEFVDLLIKMKVFTASEVATFIFNRIIFNLELFSLYPGEIEWQPGKVKFDLDVTSDRAKFDWSYFKQHLDLRQKQWKTFQPAISNPNVIPLVKIEQLNQIGNPQVEKHIASHINGKKGLIDIAAEIGKDPLKIAKRYLEWFEHGWIDFAGASLKTCSLPVVLSLDDSPIVQMMIKRSLENVCEVVLTDNAKSALEMLEQHQVELLLLDLTIPDIDGLEFCQQVRKFPKFKDLPIVMLTARDGLVNRAKGHFAGTDKYLTKPFKAEELQEVVARYTK
ncbi:MAG: response regulator [Cyanobacteria bacterium J06623_7]